MSDTNGWRDEDRREPDEFETDEAVTGETHGQDDSDSWGTVEAEIERITQERDEAIAKYQRALADYRNFQRRAEMNERRAREQGISSVLRDLLTALDHLDLALTQELQGEQAESIRAGVSLIRDDLLKTLANHGAGVIEVKPGEPFDPNRHEAMMHIPSAEIAPHHVVSQLQTGYEMGEMVLRPAKVSVARPVDEPGHEVDSAEDAGSA